MWPHRSIFPHPGWPHQTPQPAPPARAPGSSRRLPPRPPQPDPTRLPQHIDQCKGARGRMHGVRGYAEGLDAFVSPRFVSTLAALAASLAALLWLAA